MSTTYAVLLPGGEDKWREADAQQRADTYARHTRFMTALAERGHRITGGAELAHSSQARTVRATSDGGIAVTDGPYAETAEQLTGFYLVASDDVADLCRLVGILAVDGGVEIRPCVPEAGDATSTGTEETR